VSIIQKGYWRDTGTPASLAQAHFDIIDGDLDLDVPENLIIDKKGKSCTPAVWDRKKACRAGKYCWIENPDIDCTTRLEYSVIFADAVLSSRMASRNVIVTRWGEIPFDE
jgi:NDP-sugar pyrophosphorylase family protein